MNTNKDAASLVKLHKFWIILCLISIGTGGLYSILIVMLRTPVLRELIFDKSIFKIALIVHVNLTVLFWLMSFVMMQMSIRFRGNAINITFMLQRLILLSIILISISPFFLPSTAFMNNYIPVLHNLLFIIGLGLFFACFLVISLMSLWSQEKISLPIGILGLIIVCSFGISAYKLNNTTAISDQHHYYELLFWGCGHLLQFLYLSGMIIAWYDYRHSGKILSLPNLLWLNTIIASPPLLMQIFIKIEDPYYISLFTEHMKIFGGIPLLISVTDIIISYFISRESRYDKPRDELNLKLYSLLLSLFLFLSGGIIALFISGSNTIIPAHYHGSIVGITIAYMSYIYLETNKLFTPIKFNNALNQLILYSTCQFVHIVGLAASGGYGALRKTDSVDLSVYAKISLGLMGVGGLLAIVGGLIFVYICLNSIMRDCVVQYNKNSVRND